MNEHIGHLVFWPTFLESNKARELYEEHLGVMSTRFAFTGSAALLQAQQTSGGTEKAIAALENQWLQAQQTNNPDLVAPLLADKFVSTGADGKVTNKVQALADAKASKFVSAENENVQVTVFGDTAIATGLWVGKGTDEKASLWTVITAGPIHG